MVDREELKRIADESIEHFGKCLAGYPDRYQYYSGMVSGITYLASRLQGEPYFGPDWHKIAMENGWMGPLGAGQNINADS